MKILFCLILITFNLHSEDSESIHQNFTFSSVVLRGVIIDVSTKEVVSSKITVMDENNKVQSRLEFKEEFFISNLTPGKTYILRIEKQGYFSLDEEYTVPLTNSYKEFSHDYVIEPIQVGFKYLVDVVPFDKGKSELKANIDYLFLDLVKIMRKYRKAKFQIEVYPKSENPNDTDIAKARGEVFKKYFVDKRIRASLTNVHYEITDPQYPPPVKKRAKGKSYKGSIYLKVLSI
ncbi:hypothetical protein OAQ99_00790 [Candidatus Kapabacteria bacterium]|nr:hypothetical protein [Candidatus Kapabacteria bacterium]